MLGSYTRKTSTLSWTASVIPGVGSCKGTCLGRIGSKTDLESRGCLQAILIHTVRNRMTDLAVAKGSVAAAVARSAVGVARGTTRLD